MNDDQLITMFSAFVAERPGDPRFARLGDIYLQKGDLRKALEILTAGVAANPTYTTGQQVLARALLKAGYLKEARDRFEIVLRIDPGNAAAIWEIAKIDFKQGNTKDGIERLKGLLIVDPFDERAKRELKNLNVPVQASSLPEKVITETLETKAPAPPPKQEIVFEAEKRSAPSVDEISSVEKELEELLKMDLSGAGAEAGFEQIGGIDEGQIAKDSVFEPSEDLEELAVEGIEAKEDFVSPEVASAKRASESLLESAVASIEESMPEFDLGAFTVTPEAVKPSVPLDSKAEDLSEGLSSFDLGALSKPVEEPRPPAPEAKPKPPEEDFLDLSVDSKLDEDFDFTPPTATTQTKSAAKSPEPDLEAETVIDDTFDFTPPSPQPAPRQEGKLPSPMIDEDFSGFKQKPEPAPAKPPVKPPSMADALKQLEVVEESAPFADSSKDAFAVEPPQFEEPPAEAKIPSGGAFPSEEPPEKVTADDIPSFDMGGHDEEPANITSIGGYHFTEDIGQDAVPEGDGIEFRHEFRPTDEPIELEGLEATSSFLPPGEKLTSPEFSDLDFADELDGIVPRKNQEPEGESLEEVEEEPDGLEDQDIPTVTYAEICVGQGKIKKALSIYKAILAKTSEPGEKDRFEKRIDHLKKILASGLDAGSS